MENKLNRRQENEGRQGVESKQEDQDQEPSQEDESDKTHNLGIIHPTSQPKPRITIETILFKC
jgi:hypothetical protein